MVENGSRILASVVASQLDTHGKYGGVVPELASREHLRAIVPVVREALAQASTSWADLSAIAVTSGPGLVGSLLVGMTFAKAVALVHGLPLIAVNHIEGHIHAVLSQQEVPLPALALVVSGGHTHLYEVRPAGAESDEPGYRYRLLGRTRDDAAGEAFDKVAKLLGFGYPGGPILDRLAAYGDPHAVRFTLAKMKGNPLDFSFSGLKTAVLRWVEAREMGAEIAQRKALLRERPHPSLEEWLQMTPPATRDLIASFQHTVVEELVRRAAVSAAQVGAASIVLSGGVACNSALRSAAPDAAHGLPVFFPSSALSTDNAAMIAAAAFPKFERREYSGWDLKAEASLSLA